MRTLKTKSSRAYDRVLTFQEKTVDEWEQHLVWEDVVDMDASIVPRSATRTVDGAQEIEITKFDIFIPWSEHREFLLRGNRERRLLDEDDRAFYVETVIDIMEQRRELKATCTERPK